jgi:hypothetical protein
MLYGSDTCTWCIWYKVFLYYTFKFVLIIYWVKHLKFNNMRFISFMSLWIFAGSQQQRDWSYQKWMISQAELFYNELIIIKDRLINNLKTI